MFGQVHKPRRPFVSLAAIALAVLVAPAVGGASRSHSVSSLRARDAAIAGRSRSAVLGLYALDQQLAAVHAQLGTLHRRALSLRAQRAILRRQLAIARRGTRIAQRQLADRIRALYDEGTVEPLEVVFGATNLDEAMSNLESLSRAAGQGEDVLRELKAARRQLAATSHELTTRESQLAAATRGVEATASELETSRAERTRYISSLAATRRMTERQIAAVVARAHAAQIRSAQLVRARVSAAVSAAAAAPVVAAPPTPSAPAPAPEAAAPATLAAPAPAGARTLTVTATGYALGGTTATGLPVGWGIAAVDPSVIPLGTHFTVPGYGQAVAADTGGAVAGDTIDLWFPTVAQANAWGRRTVTIVLH